MLRARVDVLPRRAGCRATRSSSAPTPTRSTYFVGSILFTAGGTLQLGDAYPERDTPHTGPPGVVGGDRRVPTGTLFFNVHAYMALDTAMSDPDYDRLVWRPDAFGSVCFLVPGLIAYRASPVTGSWPLRDAAGWWEPG